MAMRNKDGAPLIFLSANLGDPAVVKAGFYWAYRTKTPDGEDAVILEPRDGPDGPIGILRSDMVRLSEESGQRIIEVCSITPFWGPPL
jgi:hypothetical protein